MRLTTLFLAAIAAPVTAHAADSTSTFRSTADLEAKTISVRGNNLGRKWSAKL